MSVFAKSKIQNRYLIISSIGKGGMGEVYSAQDIKLGREVAIKLLKKTDDEEKIKRFRQEAKILSGLNHPNILTIYDYGQHEDFYFIVSELVKGENLRKFITDKRLSLTEVLEIAIQIGKALAAAHRSGIIHRDLKPENIMMSVDDDHIKVLDFGLAKFFESESNLTQKPDETTASIFHTKNGLIAGTLYYMSPEQLRGHSTDEKSDIWSLGVVLFELITKQRPFTGDNNGDIIASILERVPSSVLGINPMLPAEIEIVLEKALAKKKEHRFQTAADFVEALKSIRSKIENSDIASLIVESKSDQPNTSEIKAFSSFDSDSDKVTHSINSKTSFFKSSRQISKYLLAFVSFCFLIGSGYFYFYVYSAEPAKLKQTKVKRLPTAGNIVNGVISPEGRFVAFVQSDNGKQSLWLRLVDEVAGKELISASSVNYSGLNFSPDGNSIFFTSFADRASGILKRISILGGPVQEVIKDVDSSVSFSPDGERLAFIRVKSREGLNQIIVANADGSAERIVSERKQPKFYSVSARENLAWSPDGKMIACPIGQKDSSGEFMNIAGVDVDNGAEKIISDHRWFRIGKVIWTKNYDELLVAATEFASAPFQLIKVNSSTGKLENFVNDLSDYVNVSTTTNATQLLGVIFDKNSNIFIASIENPEQSRQLSGGGFDGIGGVIWTSDQKILFVSTESGNRDIWLMDSTGGERRQLTFDKASDDFPVASNDGKYIVFVSDRAGLPHIWRMDLNGTNLKQVTNGMEESFPQITPDGNTIIYSARSEGRWVLWRTSIDGENAVPLTDEQTRWASISPNGKLIACLGRENIPNAPIKLVVISYENGKVINRFGLIGEVAAPDIVPILRWLPGNQAVAYISTQNNVSNIFSQPVKGGDAKKITNFSADKIFSFDWSKEGKNIVLSRGVMRSDLILMENF